MTQTFYTKWQSSVLADAGNYVSKEYNNFQTALLSEISKYAKAVDAAVVAESKGHYLTSCFIERNGKFYLYCPTPGGTGMGVLVADSPFGPFKDPIGKPLVMNMLTIFYADILNLR